MQDNQPQPQSASDPENITRTDDSGRVREELGATRAERDALKAQAEALQGLKSEVETMFNPRATDAQRQEALSRVMLAGGLDENDARQLVQSLHQEEEDDTPQPADADEDNVIGRYLQSLNDRVQTVEKAAAKTNQERSRELLQNSIQTAFDKSPDTADLLQKLEAVRGKEHSEKVRDFLRKDMMRETLENLYARKQQMGSFDNKWISQEADRAAKSVLEKAKAMVVTDGVGNAPSGSDDMALISELATKEVKPLQFDPKKDKGQVATDVDTWTVQKLQQIAARAATRAAGGDTKA